MVKKISFLIALFAASLFSFGQQKYQFTQYMFDKMAFNPGYAGTKNAICVSGLLRQQWVGFRDTEGNKVAPETFNISSKFSSEIFTRWNRLALTERIKFVF